MSASRREHFTPSYRFTLSPRAGLIPATGFVCGFGSPRRPHALSLRVQSDPGIAVVPQQGIAGQRPEGLR